jgi:hypothetical protein
VTRLKWKLILVRLEAELILTQDRCTVYAKHAIGSVIILDTPDGVMSNFVLVHLEMVFVLVHDRCMVCAKRIIGSGIILEPPDGTPRGRGSSGSLFLSVWR